MKTREFDENGVEAFDEKALVEEEPSDNDLAEEELLSQGTYSVYWTRLSFTWGDWFTPTANGRRRSLFRTSCFAW